MFLENCTFEDFDCALVRQWPPFKVFWDFSSATTGHNILRFASPMPAHHSQTTRRPSYYVPSLFDTNFLIKSDCHHNPGGGGTPRLLGCHLPLPPPPSPS